MSPRVLAVVAVCAWLGSTLVLSTHARFGSVSLTRRLAPHQPGSRTRRVSRGAGIVEILGSILVEVGGRFERLVPASPGRGELRARLERSGRAQTAEQFRYRQFAAAATALFGASALATVSATPGPLTALLVLGGPVLAALLVEHQLDRDADRRRRRLALELPVVTEQLGMLLSAGYSMHGAMHRLAHRGTGVCCSGLRSVLGRVEQGMSHTDALREWAATAAHPGLDRLVAVLCLDRETGDLGRLMSREARSIRSDHHRDLLEAIERRGQQVWIPVTLAALVPGAILVSVPFLEALRAFGANP